MKAHNNKKLPAAGIVLFLLAVVMLLGSTIGGARAALKIFSEDYTSQIEMYHIGVTLNENGKAVSSRDYVGDNEWKETSGNRVSNDGVLLADMIPEGENLKLGMAYKEELSATNSGDINTYVRMIIRKYWVMPEGSEQQDAKQTGLFPDQIDLKFAKGGWIKDEKLSTEERTVLYYSKMLKPGESTSIATETLTIDPSVARVVGYKQEGNVIYTIYEYDGMRFNIEAEVDAVQDHNAADAIASAWGADVSVSGESLSIN